MSFYKQSNKLHEKAFYLLDPSHYMVNLYYSTRKKIDAFSAEKYGVAQRKVALFSAEKQRASKASAEKYTRQQSVLKSDYF